MSDPIKKLIEFFSDFPTVGSRTAQRFVFYLIRQPEEKIKGFIELVQELKNKIKHCEFCFNPFNPSEAPKNAKDKEQKLCEICSNIGRDKSALCIVEKEADLESIEKTKKYKGLYFILGGNVAALKKSDLKNIRVKELEERLRSPQSFGIITIFKEIIIATNPTPEGKATALLVEKIIKQTLKDNLPRITHLGLGLPVGGELEYADEETLESALFSRK